MVIGYVLCTAESIECWRKKRRENNKRFFFEQTHNRFRTTTLSKLACTIPIPQGPGYVDPSAGPGSGRASSEHRKKNSYLSFYGSKQRKIYSYLSFYDSEQRKINSYLSFYGSEHRKINSYLSFYNNSQKEVKRTYLTILSFSSSGIPTAISFLSSLN